MGSLNTHLYVQGWEQVRAGFLNDITPSFSLPTLFSSLSPSVFIQGKGALQRRVVIGTAARMYMSLCLCIFACMGESAMGQRESTSYARSLPSPQCCLQPCHSNHCRKFQMQGRRF